MIDHERLLLRPAEVAEKLGIGRSTAYELIAAGKLPTVRVGKVLRVPKQALDQWLEAEQKKRSAKTNLRHSSPADTATVDHEPTDGAPTTSTKLPSNDSERND